MIRPLLALPVIIYLWKVIAWDKVLGLGTTDAIGGDVGIWAIRAWRRNGVSRLIFPRLASAPAAAHGYPRDWPRWWQDAVKRTAAKVPAYLEASSEFCLARFDRERTNLGRPKSARFFLRDINITSYTNRSCSEAATCCLATPMACSSCLRR
jgi:hypothetical protein